MKELILLTGCAGFIGSNFVKKIACREDVKNKYSFFIIDSLTYAGHLSNIQPELDKNPHLRFERIDIRDSKLIEDLFEKNRFSGVINFAAESHVDRSISQPSIFVETNVFGTFNLLNESLKALKNYSQFRYMQISTDEVYGSLNPQDAPFTENSPLAPNSPYSASKAGADLLVRSFFETYKLPTIVSRCSNNYGPFQNEEKFIPTMIKKALTDQKMPVYGNGENIRDWIHVDDHNEGVWLAFLNGRPGEVYNFGGNCEKRNIDLAKAIVKSLGKSESQIEFVKDREGHDFRYAINFKKAQSELNWIPKINFESTGLSNTISYYQSLWKL